VSITFVEKDGSSSELDLTAHVNLLLELGAGRPRTEAEHEAATAVLGELSCSDEAVFTQTGEPVDAETCLGIIGEGLYRALCDIISGKKSSGLSPEEPAPVSMVVELTEKDSAGRSYLNVPDAFWAMGCIADHERFDLIELGEGALLMRVCPYTEAEYRDVHNGEFHGDDPEFHPGSYCGLTKWTCAGCGGSTIVETEEEFPAGWLEVDLKQTDGDVAAFEAVCSMGCLGGLGAKQRSDLKPTRIPGFAPAAVAAPAQQEG
jgi:hypothetical protein